MITKHCEVGNGNCEYISEYVCRATAGCVCDFGKGTDVA